MLRKMYQETLQCVLVDGLQRTSWIERELRKNYNAYLRNADLVSFEEEKCCQYHYLTSSFVRRALKVIAVSLHGFIVATW